MKPVRTTPTSTDKQVELLGIQLEINKAKSERKDIENKVDMLNSGYKDRIKRLVEEVVGDSKNIKDQTGKAFSFWNRLEDILAELNVQSSDVKKSVDAKHTNLVNLETAIDEKKKDKVVLVSKIEALRNSHKAMIKKSNLDSSNFAESIKSENKKTKEMSKEIAGLRLQKQSVQKELDAGEKEFKDRAEYLSRKEADLNIYEARVRYKFNEIFPGKIMVLPKL